MLSGRFAELSRKRALRRGVLVASTLRASWRTAEDTPLHLTEAELDEITPLLCVSGAAGVGWNRIGKSHLKDTPSAEVLHQAYRLQVLQTSIHEEKVAETFRLFRRASIDAILAKGWAAAAFYPNNFRPPGDIDVCVGPDHYRRAQEALLSDEATGLLIDLHKHFSELEDRRLADIFSRSRMVPLHDEDIRIIGDEDHFALLCIHFLKHGGWRPLWLCDIGAAVESLPPTFDWNICLGANKKRAGWILMTVKLAHLLLGADLSKCPAAADSPEPPSWMVENIFKHWCNPSSINQAPLSHPTPMLDLLKRPAELPNGLRQRWPDPILATVSVNGEFNSLPRFPYQVANCVTRVTRFLVGKKHQESNLEEQPITSAR